MLNEGTIELRVRYSECDAMGVAHHGSYPTWFEMGRTELLRDRGVSYRELEALGVFIVVVKLEVSYKQPARYDDVLQLVTRLAETGRARIEHDYELRREAAVLATGRTVLACVDDQGQVQPVPDVLRDRNR